MNKWCILMAFAGLGVMGIGYFLWFSPFLMLIGGIWCIAGFRFAVQYSNKDNTEVTEKFGCLLFLVIGLLVVCVFMSSMSYVSTFGGKRHIYIDCEHQEGDEMHELTKCSAFLWGCFSECKYCQERQKLEKEKRKLMRKEEQRKRNLAIINKQIEKLQEIRDAILSGEDVDIDDYSFRYEVEEDIRNEAIEEYNEDYENNYEIRGRR